MAKVAVGAVVLNKLLMMRIEKGKGQLTQGQIDRVRAGELIIDQDGNLQKNTGRQGS